jgi:hypothetical protein
VWAKAGAADATAANVTATRDRLRIDDASNLKVNAQQAIFAMTGCSQLKRSPFELCRLDRD